MPNAVERDKPNKDVGESSAQGIMAEAEAEIDEVAESKKENGLIFNQLTTATE